VAFWAYGQRPGPPGELSPGLPLTTSQRWCCLFSGWWLLGERPTLSSKCRCGDLLVRGALCWTGTARCSAWFKSPGARPMLAVAVAPGAWQASFDQARQSSQQQPSPGGVVSTWRWALRCSPRPCSRPPGQWQPLNGLETWRQALASKPLLAIACFYCWSLRSDGCGPAWFAKMEGLRFNGRRPCDASSG